MSSGTIDSETKVLVVEDEMVLRMRAVEIVEDAGFTAIEAINADEALTISNRVPTSRCFFLTFRCPATERTGPWRAR